MRRGLYVGIWIAACVLVLLAVVAFFMPLRGLKFSAEHEGGSDAAAPGAPSDFALLDVAVSGIDAQESPCVIRLRSADGSVVEVREPDYLGRCVLGPVRQPLEGVVEAVFGGASFGTATEQVLGSASLRILPTAGRVLVELRCAPPTAGEHPDRVLVLDEDYWPVPNAMIRGASGAGASVLGYIGPASFPSGGFVDPPSVRWDLAPVSLSSDSPPEREHEVVVLPWIGAGRLEVRSPDGGPIGGVRARRTSGSNFYRSARAAVRGTAVFGSLEPGEYDVWADCDHGRVAAAESVRVRPGDNTVTLGYVGTARVVGRARLPLGTTRATLALRERSPRALTVPWRLSSHPGRELPEFAGNWTRTYRAIPCGPGGEFAFERVLPGEYELEVETPELHGSRCVVVTSDGSGETHLDIGLLDCRRASGSIVVRRSESDAGFAARVAIVGGGRTYDPKLLEPGAADVRFAALSPGVYSVAATLVGGAGGTPRVGISGRTGARTSVVVGSTDITITLESLR